VNWQDKNYLPHFFDPLMQVFLRLGDFQTIVTRIALLDDEGSVFLDEVVKGDSDAFTVRASR
jgi:hypothetical protein